MRFNFILISVSIALLLFAALFEVNYINYESPIEFAQWQKISFDDFRAFKKPGAELEGNDDFAYINCGREISFENENDSTLKIVSLFYPTRSYVYNEGVCDPALLRHELYHFKITEYFSRCLREDIMFQDITIDHIDRRNNKYIDDENKMQAQYDKETDHSAIEDQQLKWQKYIDSLNDDLAAFADPVFSARR